MPGQGVPITSRFSGALAAAQPSLSRPARQLGLEEQIGSLEEGKDADLAVLSGDPLSVYTKVEQTWVEGEQVFDRSDPEHLAYALGGLDVYRGFADVHHLEEGWSLEEGGR